jgi:uncharacterized protein (DUF2147 family)
MFNKQFQCVVALSALVFSGLAAAQATPVGLWKTIDDKTKTERSLVRITESGGVLTGKVEKLLAPDAKQDAVCDLCTDDLQDKPLLGLPVVRGVKQDDDDKTLWGGGTITDAKEGKVYKVRLKPIEGGAKLEVRGYIGLPMLGRTQTWIRVE